MNSAGYLAYGRHVLADISDTPAGLLDDLELLESLLVSAASAEGVTVLGTLKHAFQPSGVTILLLLAESHVSLHTYPDQGRAFFDAFTCGVDYEPANILRTFVARATCGSYRLTQIERGEPVAVKEASYV